MKVLSIGNSFSSDATRYLSAIAKSCGVNLESYNLYIGGCSLRTHYVNALEDLELYSFVFNGDDTHIKVSIREALIANEYDVVTLQQVSSSSFKPETFQPYCDFFLEYIKKYNPHAKIFIHQTWGYKSDTAKLASMGFATHAEMYDKVESAYDIMYDIGGFSGLLPSGKAMSLLHENGFYGDATHRDDIHASLGLGRYTLALAWFEYLTGVPACDCDFSDFDVPVSEKEIAAAKDAAHKACIWAEKYRK